MESEDSVEVDDEVFEKLSSTAPSAADDFLPQKSNSGPAVEKKSTKGIQVDQNGKKEKKSEKKNVQGKARKVVAISPVGKKQQKAKGKKGQKTAGKKCQKKKKESKKSTSSSAVARSTVKKGVAERDNTKAIKPFFGKKKAKTPNHQPCYSRALTGMDQKQVSNMNFAMTMTNIQMGFATLNGLLEMYKRKR